MLGFGTLWNWVTLPFRKKDGMESPTNEVSPIEKVEAFVEETVAKVAEVVEDFDQSETPVGMGIPDMSEEESSSSSFIVPLLKVAGPFVGAYLLYKAWQHFTKPNDSNK